MVKINRMILIMCLTLLVSACGGDDALIKEAKTKMAHKSQLTEEQVDRLVGDVFVVNGAAKKSKQVCGRRFDTRFVFNDQKELFIEDHRNEAEFFKLYWIYCESNTDQALKTTTAANKLKTPPEWKLQESTSAVDDSKTVYLTLDVDNQFKGEKTTLSLRCKEGETEAIVDLETFLSTGEVKTTTRIDKEKAEIESWLISSNFKALFHPKPMEFIKSMIGHNKLLFQVTPYSKDPVEMTFSIAGLDKVVGTLQEACNWE